VVSGRRYFREVEVGGQRLWDLLARQPERPPADMETACAALDYLHMAVGLLEPYGRDYPLVEPRELVPSFDAPLIEYKHLPAFSMVLLDRPISYQDECFQFDLLLPEGHPPDPSRVAANRQLLRQRLPRDQVPELEQVIGRRSLTPFSRYAELLPFLARMDRGHVIARDEEGWFQLVGIFASFPSDLDGEIKRLGRRIGKFRKGDNESYAANRLFVYRFLMEQTGFPVCGERHTSAALFARRLMRRRERFLVKVLGHSDRTITALTSQGATQGLPRVEKVALVEARGCSEEGYRRLREGGFFVDRRRRVVLLRVRYTQHRYHPDNVLEERALSVQAQEVIHPQTGQVLEADVLGLGQDRLLLLNDIVRGEYPGCIVFRDQEQVCGTREIGKRLKFLLAWLRKHRHILADYSPDTFERVSRVLASFLNDPELADDLARYPELVAELKQTVGNLRHAHRLRLLEKLVHNRADASGRRLHHVHVLTILAHVLSQEGEHLAQHHPQLLAKLLTICRRELQHPYLKKRYLTRLPRTPAEREVVGEYKLLERLVNRFEGRLDAAGR